MMMTDGSMFLITSVRGTMPWKPASLVQCIHVEKLNLSLKWKPLDFIGLLALFDEWL